MRCFIAKALVRCGVIICVTAIAANAEAITEIVNRNVEMNDGGNTGIINRPFFTLGGPDGYVGTAISGGTDTTSTVTNPNVGIGGNNTVLVPNNNGVPMGVGFNFGVEFTVETGDPGHVLSDGGNPGLGINSGGGDPNTIELSPGEQLFFSDIQITNFSIQDPLGLILPGATVGNPRWKAMRSATFSGGDMATTSSDAAATMDVKTFLGNNPANPTEPKDIENNYTKGTFGPMSSVYITTTAGNWPLKGIRYEVEINYELAPVPATRRTFQFGELQPGTYEGGTMHQLSDVNQMDSNITITAVGGTNEILDTNDLGVGVNSLEDDFTDGIATSNNSQRFIDGSLSTPEAIHFSFDRDVSLESLTLGNLDLDGSEGVVLSFVSGTNPFTGLTGYTGGDYTLGVDSLTFNTSSGGQTPYTITYGMNDQDDIMILEGTVLSLTSNPAFGNGFLLDMITVNVPSVTLDGDHNGDGTVDAADYVVWRKTNVGDEQGYLDWQANFGSSNLGSGGGSALGAVPEPGCVALAIMGLLIAGGCYRRQVQA